MSFTWARSSHGAVASSPLSAQHWIPVQRSSCLATWSMSLPEHFGSLDLVTRTTKPRAQTERWLESSISCALHLSMCHTGAKKVSQEPPGCWPLA